MDSETSGRENETTPHAHRFSHGDHVDTEDLDWPTAYELTKDLIYRLRQQNFHPDRIVAIYDPEHSGGYAVACQVAALMGGQDQRSEPQVDLIRIEGNADSRTVTEAPDLPASIQRLLIIDDVSWSGNTMKIAKNKLISLSEAQIKTATLLAGEPAITNGIVDFWARSSNARDVRFPWGIVTPTAEFAQYFQLPTQSERRPVSWAPRPWGYWEEFALNEICTVRILTIFPGQSLSLHSHKQRDEFFIALDDGIRLQVGDKTLVANRGDYVLIPRFERHREFAPPTDTVRVLEISFGHYDQIGDIVRFEDNYGRVNKNGSV
jgi:mannose-6-phosphate isomerase